MSLLRSTFIGKAKKLQAVDIHRIAKTINCGEDELRAFMDVEAAGSGFDIFGRPKMLFEPHIFYRNLSGEKRDRAVALGLAYRKWGEQKYPADSYLRLKKAMALDEDAALKSASWGLGQVMGFHFNILGYNTIQDMVLDFMDDEENHLEAMVLFLIHNDIDDDLANHNWETVARLYNGPGYKKNNYDVKLQQSFNKWKGVKDYADVIPHTQIRFNHIGSIVKTLQEKLGIEQSGIFDKETLDAVIVYQTQNGLKPDGVVGNKTWSSLFQV